MRAYDRVDGPGIKRALVLLIVFLLAIPLLRAESCADEAPRRVLILHSYNYTFPAAAVVSEALRKTLGEFPGRLEIEAEYLDLCTASR